LRRAEFDRRTPARNRDHVGAREMAAIQQHGVLVHYDSLEKNAVIPAQAGIQIRTLAIQQLIPQIAPLGIVILDQLQLPGPIPLFDLLLATNG
jgi:hypothetical protein